MHSYPLQLNLDGRRCVVVGGGHVGLRKVQGLLAAGARVKLVEPLDAAPACALKGVERVPRGFEPEDLAGALLVFAACDAPEVNREVAEVARRRGVLCCRVDDPNGGDFALPAQLRRGELLVTVSSGGAHPGFAAALRDRIAEDLDESWSFITALAGALRRRQLTPGESQTYNRKVMRALLDERLPVLVASCDWQGVEGLMQELLGDKLSLAQLGLPLPTDKT